MVNEQVVKEYLLYSRLQDVLMTLGTNAILKVNVNLYQDRRNNSREYYRGEVQYLNKSGKLSRKVIRKIDAVLLIENMKPFNKKKEVIAVRAGDIELMRLLLLPWLEDIVKDLGSVYAFKDEKLCIIKELPAMEISLGTSKIWFKPGIFSNTYTNEVNPCLDLCLNDPDNISKIPYESVSAFMGILRLFQLHQYAATMLASFENNQTMGLNLYDMTQSQNLNSIDQYVYDEPTEVKNYKKKGFFDTQMNERK